MPLHVDAFCFVAGGAVAQYDTPPGCESGKARYMAGLPWRMPYAFDMSGGFVPFRRDVSCVTAEEALIKPLLGGLEFVEDRAHWGCKLRFGLFQVCDSDMRLIAQAMRANLELLHL